MFSVWTRTYLCDHDCNYSSYHLCSGSPPSQPLKVPDTDVISSVVCFSVPQPTPQKNATGCKGRRKAARDQFTVYIDKNGIH